MATPTLITYRDAIDHVVQYLGAMPQEAEQNRVRAAVQAAYREISLASPWRYLTAHKRINVSAPYTTGTVAYDSTTGQVTLTTGTWPSWVRYGRLLFSGDATIYKVAEQDSTDSSIITLDTDFSPGSDVTAGTSYTLFRSVYPLPADIRSIDEVLDETGMWATSYVEPTTLITMERQLTRSGAPFYWTIMGAEDLYGQLALCLHGYPDTAQSFDFMCQRSPRAMKYDGYGLHSSQEDALLSAATVDQAGFTISGVTMNADMVGSVLRLGRTDSSIEDPPSGLGSRNPYSEQKIITAVPTTTTGTVDSNFDYGLGTDGHFIISDPVDLPHYMLTLFERACEYQIAIAQQPDRLPHAKLLRDTAMKQAMAHNAFVPVPTVGQHNFRLPSWGVTYGTIVVS